ncbi:MAG: patatin-like phospholipase family protein [Rhodospirillales bacterium]|nr:patatin-like phospholipase family protein [Rhodospirillales bacterium]
MTRDTKVGLALSGGGTRAMAFHLGCLRALNDVGILGRVEVISGVSGGSVASALLARCSTFTEFEARMRMILRRGLIWPAIGKLITTIEGGKALMCWAVVAPLNAVLGLLSFCIWIVSLCLKAEHRAKWRSAKLYSPVRRFASRTTVLQRVFDEDVFEGCKLRELEKDKPLLIITAADLRTGSAFYFSPRNCGSWRLGQLADTNVTVGFAVAASTAYPMALPALDMVLPFDRKEGTRRTERVSLTDGGVYDNLGLAALWPDRDPEISLNVTVVDTIICCRAGYGPRFDPPSQMLLGRIKSAFFCTHDRTQNAATKRLFDLLEGGKLKGVLMPYLGQNDRRLKYPPENLVTREETFAYPTDFFAMSEEWVEKLSLRGEQLTRALLAEHLPHLLGEK